MITSDNYSFWSRRSEDVLKDLTTSLAGLSSNEALSRHERVKRVQSPLIQNIKLFIAQYKSPLLLLLIVALVLAAVLGDIKEAIIIFIILFFSSMLNFLQEKKAGKAAEKLRAMLRIKARVRRDNKLSEVAIEDLVPGDIILLDAGDIIASDSLILDSTDLYVNESVLTGESFPSEKKAGVLAEDTQLKDRQNSVFKGTNVVSGTATVVAVKTGAQTELGKIETDLGIGEVETAFEKGIKKFGYMLMRVGLLLAGIIIVTTLLTGKKPLDSILFALALSIGLTPEMLPAIVTITLSEGAKRLAEKKVIVKKLSSVQNLGSIDILCSDKTGTITEGEIKVDSYLSVDEEKNNMIQQYAYLNAFFESGYENPMDQAIREQSRVDITGYEKSDEVPYDFIRKRLSIVVTKNSRHVMITKGALGNIVEVCSHVQVRNEQVIPIASYLNKITQLYEQFSAKGFRVIGLGYKDVTGDPVINKDDETDLIFLGFILLYDPPKKSIRAVIGELNKKNIALKVITGDNALIAANIADQIGIPSERLMSGKELHVLSDDELLSRIDDIDIFSETEPSQKERIVKAYQKKGHVVGYLGDGINDAPALKAADVGISVSNAVDVARESADMILMEKELEVMCDGISEGRKTYLNTLKYIFITVSANFGNMLSMACASMFLPFLPLLPSQILLTNLLTDIPALSIASDNVDAEMLQRPRKWDAGLIQKFMIVFGLESSVFDFLSFGTLILIFHASEKTFRTGWFVESVLTEILILLIIRTRRTFIKSKPGKLLLTSSLIVAGVVIVTPYIPFFAALGFTPLSANLMLILCGISILYAMFGELTKKILFRKINY